MVTIRLARTGRNKYSTYRVVAAESSRPVTGKFIAILGHYNPHTKQVSLKKEQTEKYLQQGAQPSNSVIKLLQQESIKLPEWVRLQTKHKAPKSEPAAEVKAAPATTEPAAEPSNDQAVAETAAEASEVVEGQAPAATDLDTDHTDTASSESKQAEAAIAADDAAAEVALEAADQNKSESTSS